MSDSPGNKLADRLRERIKREGPIMFRDWMQAALYDEREGYYCRRDRIRQGRAGDYRTAPETSPLFAATFARYFAKLFVELGSPAQFTIVEIGAGTGDFARGVLANLKSNNPAVFSAVNFVIEEIGAGSREQIAARLSEFSGHLNIRTPSVTEGQLLDPALPNRPTSTGLTGGGPRGQAGDPITGIIFSNELIDAFPVHRVIGRGGALKELCVGLSDADEFVWVDSELSPRVFEYCQRIQLQLAEEQIHEINLDAETFVRRVSSLIERGLLITVDYGAERNYLVNDPNRFKGTLRTFHQHQLGDDALSHPGDQDLTATVDWTQMIEAGERNGFETLRLQRLDEFLLTQGALEELAIAAATISNQADLFNLNAGARELIMPDGLAASFQVLAQRKGS